MKICIASKNRAKKATTHKLFSRQDVMFFVEPQEYKKYKIEFPQYKIINIGKDDQGLCFVRNFILDFMNEPFVMADDDIISLKDKNNHKDTNEMIAYFENKINHFGQIGISFQASNWLHSGIKLFDRAWAIKVLNPEKIKNSRVRFGTNFGLFEDYEFTINLILNGVLTGTTYNWMFSCLEKMGVMQGGCQVFRTADRSKEAALEMKQKYGKYVKITFNENHNQYEIQPQWSKLKKFYELKYGSLI